MCVCMLVCCEGTRRGSCNGARDGVDEEANGAQEGVGGSGSLGCDGDQGRRVGGAMEAGGRNGEAVAAAAAVVS
jgi:hypothetical protein